MTCDELIMEAEQLALPCLILSRAQPGESIVGFWGIRDDSMDEGIRLWVRVDCTWLQRHGFNLDGYLSIYADESLCDFTVVYTPHEQLPPDENQGIPLSGHNGLSLPQEEAILAFRMAAGRKPEALSREALILYRERQLESAFAGWATLGGWRTSWPDDDDDPDELSFWQADRRLVLRTSHDAEPWVEVWMHGDGRLEAVARIT